MTEMDAILATDDELRLWLYNNRTYPTKVLAVCIKRRGIRAWLAKWLYSDRLRGQVEIAAARAGFTCFWARVDRGVAVYKVRFRGRS